MFLFIILLYRSFKSEVANLPPSSCTIGLRSGEITGIASRIIHSGLFPDWIKASITSSLLETLIAFCPVAPSISAFNISDSFSRSICFKSFFTASAPIPASNWSPYSLFSSLYSTSDRICFTKTALHSGSTFVTIYEAKYRTFSKALGLISRASPILEGMPLKYQICETGAASSM